MNDESKESYIALSRALRFSRRYEKIPNIPIKLGSEARIWTGKKSGYWQNMIVKGRVFGRDLSSQGVRLRKHCPV